MTCSGSTPDDQYLTQLTKIAGQQSMPILMTYCSKCELKNTLLCRKGTAVKVMASFVGLFWLTVVGQTCRM